MVRCVFYSILHYLFGSCWHTDLRQSSYVEKYYLSTDYEKQIIKHTWNRVSKLYEVFIYLDLVFPFALYARVLIDEYIQPKSANINSSHTCALLNDIY